MKFKKKFNPVSTDNIYNELKGITKEAISDYNFKDFSTPKQDESNIKFSFDAIVQSRLEKIVSTLKSKASEYSKKGNRFHHFKVASRIKNETPEKALYGMMIKHEVSVLDMIDNPTDACITEKLVDEKIGDLVNYLILLEGLLKERLFKKTLQGK